jgi:hypothetical protein
MLGTLNVAAYAEWKSPRRTAVVITANGIATFRRIDRLELVEL